MQLDKSFWKKLALVVGGGILFAFLLSHLELVGSFLGFIWGLLFPFVLGYIVAFLLNIPMSAIERHLFKNRCGRARRPLAFVLTLVLVLGVIAFVVVLVVPQLWATGVHLYENMDTYLDNAYGIIEPYLEYLPVVEQWLDGLNIDWRSLPAQIGGLLQSGAGNFLSSAVGAATGFVNGIVSFFVGLIFAVYLLLDKEHLTAQLQGLLQAYLPKKRYDKVLEVARLTHGTYTRFVAGQCLEALIVTVIHIIPMLIFRFDYALLISVLVGFTSLIPIVGGFIGCFIGAFLLLISMGFWRALAFVIMYIVIQQIEGNLIYPHVVGNSIGLPPVWVLVAVMIGGGLAGIFGMLFFIPLFSVVYTLLHRSARARLEKRGLASPVGDLAPEHQKRSGQRRRRRPGAGGGTPPKDAPAEEGPPENEQNAESRH